MDKRQAREILFTLVYEYEFNTDKSANEIYDNARESRDFENFRYIKKGLTDIVLNKNYLSDVIEKHSNNWKINRIAPVTRAILFVGAYDMIFKSTPHAVAINEALELAKSFDTDESVSFINGILNSIAKNIDDILAEREKSLSSVEESTGDNGSEE